MAILVRDDQHALLRWVVAALTESQPLPALPEIDLARLQAAGIASGLTALIGALCEDHSVVLPTEWRSFVTEQMQVVANKQRLYRTLIPQVLAALDAAGIAAIPVKGAVLAELVWPQPHARPMADFDLIVHAHDRRRAGDVLVKQGMRQIDSSSAEDTYLGWGDGSSGPSDRESAAHSGKVEAHPGWSQQLHNYAIGDAGLLWEFGAPGLLHGEPCVQLSLPGLTMQALGHLSTSVIRGEVRAVNIVDLVLLLRLLTPADAAEFAALCDRFDPRLTAPALWLLQQQVDLGLGTLAQRQLDRLPHAAQRHLRLAHSSDVLRARGARTTVRWRLAFTMSLRERAGVLRQATVPARADLGMTQAQTALWRLHARRLVRATQRSRQRLRPRLQPRLHPSLPTDPRIVYVLHADPDEVAPAETFARWPTASRTIEALRAAGANVSVVARTNAAATQITHRDVAWKFVSDQSRLGWRIALAVRHLRPAVIHVNGIGFALPLVVLRVACGFRVRIVVQHHGEPPAHGRSRFAQKFARRAADAYLFTGASGQAQPFRDADILTPATPVFEVLESSADTTAIDCAVARTLCPVFGDPAVISVGRLIAGKAPETALRAFEAFAMVRPRAQLWMLYSDATLEAPLRSIVAASDTLADRVHFVGLVDHDEIATWLSAADIFVSASRSEGSGYSLIEALRCGCIPVVSDIPSHAAIAGAVGSRFKIGDIERAAAALAEAVPDQARAQAHFDTHLGWNNVAQQLLAAYQMSGLQ